MERRSAGKYVHRKAMLFHMRRPGSLPGSAIPGCMFLDRSLINLSGPYIAFERIYQGKMNMWNSFIFFFFNILHPVR